ncbi:MAG: hypothetical protein P8Z38_07160 [Robiginitalea sp.]
MKKRNSMWVVMAIASMTLSAQDQDRDRVQDQDRTKLLVVKGEMLQLRDRAETHLREKQNLNDGTVLYPNGAYETPDGERYKLRNGESLDGDGALYRNEYQYRHKIMRENDGLSQAQIRERNQYRVQYSMIEGKVYRIENESQLRLQAPVKLANGATANPDGTYQLESRARVQLREGECLDAVGERFRNMYQMRKKMIRQVRVPAKKMIKKGNVTPKAPAKKKMSS